MIFTYFCIYILFSSLLVFFIMLMLIMVYFCLSSPPPHTPPLLLLLFLLHLFHSPIAYHLHHSPPTQPNHLTLISAYPHSHPPTHPPSINPPPLHLFPVLPPSEHPGPPQHTYTPRPTRSGAGKYLARVLAGGMRMRLGLGCSDFCGVKKG